MEIRVQKLSEEELEKKGVFNWPIWEKEISRFDWYYDTTEECYLLEGYVTVETKEGECVSFGKGDFVIFPKGLSCIWDVKEPVRKHYNLKR
ncbi:MAG: cupin [Candidatus Omnitrophota bacterium]|nr:MAG: cupin [Candidatus Omnitrophota bacterium]